MSIENIHVVEVLELVNSKRGFPAVDLDISVNLSSQPFLDQRVSSYIEGSVTSLSLASKRRPAIKLFFVKFDVSKLKNSACVAECHRSVEEKLSRISPSDQNDAHDSREQLKPIS